MKIVHFAFKNKKNVNKIISEKFIKILAKFFLFLFLLGIPLLVVSENNKSRKNREAAIKKEKVILLRKDKFYPPIHIDPR